MMKTSKRIAALALSLVLMLGVLPLGLSPEAQAASPTDALADIAYYGDREKCALTYEMAQTYVEALEAFEGKDNVEVCLADFADDGYPIMFVLDWQSDSRFDLYIFDRNGFAPIEGIGSLILSSENCSGLSSCAIDGWPAIALHDFKSMYDTQWYTVSTATLCYSGYRTSNKADGMILNGTRLERYLKEHRHYTEGETFVDFTGNTDIFSLSTSGYSNAFHALSSYVSAMTPTTYEGPLSPLVENSSGYGCRGAYYGDPSKCKMSSDMARAYAEVLDSLPAQYETSYFSGELCAALADPADDGYPILITAYANCKESSNIYDIGNIEYIRFWTYEDGIARDAEIPNADHINLGKLGDKGLILAANGYPGHGEANWYYSVSEGHIIREGTAECFFALANGFSSDNPDLVCGWAPVGADYDVGDYIRYGDDTDILDSTKLIENGWKELHDEWGWYLVLLDDKNITDKCLSPGCRDGEDPHVDSHNFGLLAYDVFDDPVYCLDTISAPRTYEPLLNVVFADTMRQALKSYILPFTDVSESAWYHQWVERAYQMGLINGKTATTYCPKDNMSYAEAVKLAACMHQRYTDGEVTLENGKDDWRSTYYDYCLEKGIIPAAPEGEELGYDELFAKASENIDRKTFVWLFSRALPAEAFPEINSIPDDSIPDVPVDDGIWDDGIYLFYRAGILNGSDAKGTFNPESSIQRSEVAAILVRMMDAHYRVDAPAELGK